jgi:hypothetical protein
MDRGEAGVVYVPSTYDLTDLLIQRYNAGEGREDMAKPAAPAKATTSGKAPAKPKGAN